MGSKQKLLVKRSLYTYLRGFRILIKTILKISIFASISRSKNIFRNQQKTKNHLIKNSSVF